MYRYIAFAWNYRVAERNSLASILISRLKSIDPEWKCVLAAEGLHVFHIWERDRPACAYVLYNDGGVVLGKLLGRLGNAGTDPHLVVLNQQEAQRIVDTNGRYLVEHYWGRYVALLREGDGPITRVLRDPTAAMPCLLSSFRGIDVICSHIEDCAALGLTSNEINWGHVIAYLWFRRFASSDTGLANVRQVRGGECITIGPDSTRATFYWQPQRIYEARAVDDRHRAMNELRTAICYCVRAWASCYTRVLHELSGGLDSAIVLACLSEEPGFASVIAENFFTQRAEGDERIFARLAAKRAGVELIERPIRASAATLNSMLDTTKCATPMQTILVPEYLRDRDRFVSAVGVEAVFSGQGGDHFFQQRKTPLIAAEYVHRRGLKPRAFRVIAETAHLTRKPIWSVLATALTSGLLRRRENPYRQWLEQPPLLAAATCDALDLSSVRHPWIDGAQHLPANKILQIMDVIDSQHLCHLPSRHADIVHPLISQPIIELCLQIPGYELAHSGIDRALVREAFSDVVPPEIIKRRTKGGTSSYVIGTLVANLPGLREFILDGILVTQGILARAKTEASLTEPSLIRDPSLLFPVLSAIQAEAWLRTWVGQVRRAVA